MIPQAYSNESLLSSMFLIALCLLAASRQTYADPSSLCKFTSLRNLCEWTLFPNSCYASLVHKLDSNHNIRSHQLRVIYRQSALIALSGMSRAAHVDFSANGTVENLIIKKMGGNNNRLALSALDSCRMLLSLAVDNLKDSLSMNNRFYSSSEARDDIRTWLSAAGTDLRTCADGFEDLGFEVRNLVLEKLRNSMEYTSNSLAIMTRISRCLGLAKKFDEHHHNHNQIQTPYWLQFKDRKLLQAINTNQLRIDLVVAQDGSGNYSTINEALNAVPNYSDKRFVIFVKSGVYYENVKVNRSKQNVMMIGDETSDTLVSGNLSGADGMSTFMTATFAVFGDGFIAQRIGFINTAPKSQAVALLSTADKSVFFQCLIESKQDSLYVHSNRQFFRECFIKGTVDFIFGNAAVVIQKSVIFPKKPLFGQANVITAQGKSDPNHNTGISIHDCSIRPGEDLTGVRTFLGRPWRDYSTTVFMQSRMESLIDPLGWSRMRDPIPPSTIFYAEYDNEGPGSDTSKRVKWNGVRVNLSSDEANRFTVSSLIDGNEWLPGTGVSFESGLL